MLNKEDKEYLDSIGFISTICHPDWSGFEICEYGFTFMSTTIRFKPLLRKYIEKIRSSDLE